MRPLILFAAAGGLAAAAVPVGATAASAIDGRYITDDGRVVITVDRCGKARCGHVTKILRPKPGVPPYDINNDDESLRDRPILGLPILTGLTPDGDEWKGTVYNPEDGNSYRSVVEPGPDGGLTVKGCVAFICKTKYWKPAG